MPFYNNGRAYVPQRMDRRQGICHQHNSLDQHKFHTHHHSHIEVRNRYRNKLKIKHNKILFWWFIHKTLWRLIIVMDIYLSSIKKHLPWFRL